MTARARDGWGAGTSTGILLGIGLVGSLDEAVLHQLLQWHNLYWPTTQQGRLLSDGAFHIATLTLLVWGTLRLWRGRLSPANDPGLIVGGSLLGAGGFNLYDGLVQHLLLHIHLVNERVCPVVHADNTVASCPRDVPFEVVFDLAAAALLLAGYLVLRRVRRATA